MCITGVFDARILVKQWITTYWPSTYLFLDFIKIYGLHMKGMLAGDNGKLANV